MIPSVGIGSYNSGHHNHTGIRITFKVHADAHEDTYEDIVSVQDAKDFVALIQAAIKIIEDKAANKNNDGNAHD